MLRVTLALRPWSTAGPSRSIKFLVVAVLAATLVSAASAARSDSSDVVWTTPTPADLASITVTAGSTVSFALTASANGQQDLVHIDAIGARSDEVLNSSDGSAARATRPAGFRPTISVARSRCTRIRMSTALA